jgi:hypothetical protein
MRITFQGYKGRAECVFDCPACGATKRKRSFTTEHTVNPFNKNADGAPKSAAQVSQEAREAARLERDQFLTAPLCKRCEDALPYKDIRALADRRRGVSLPSAQSGGAAK